MHIYIYIIYICMYLSLSLYIYIQREIHTAIEKSFTKTRERRRRGPRLTCAAQEGTGSVRFVSVQDFFENTSVRLVSVRKNKISGSTQFGLRFRTCRGSVRFGSVRFVSRFGSGRFHIKTVRFGSVRFGSISYSFMNRGQREHKGSFSGYPPKGVGAVFS